MQASLGDPSLLSNEIVSSGEQLLRVNPVLKRIHRNFLHDIVEPLSTVAGPESADGGASRTSTAVRNDQ